MDESSNGEGSSEEKLKETTGLFERIKKHFGDNRRPDRQPSARESTPEYKLQDAALNATRMRQNVSETLNPDKTKDLVADATGKKAD